MGCGEWCVYYDSRGTCSACFNCSYYIGSKKSKFELGKVDMFKLARLLKEKEERKKRKQEEITKNEHEFVLERYPNCGEKSWWFNPYKNKRECMNIRCPTYNPSSYLTNSIRHSESSDYQSEASYYIKSKLNNPMLLSVKMFLADVIHKVNMPYDWDEHNCAHFAKEIQDVASERGIRCGYVVISFENSEIGHAIIAFETDYGLKFFEPQSAKEEDMIIGRCYSAQIVGVSDDAIISKVEIFWNDGEKTIIDS